MRAGSASRSSAPGCAPPDARPADPVLLAALTDAWIPAAFSYMERPTFVPDHRPHDPLARGARHPRRASIRGCWACSTPTSAPAGRRRKTASCGARSERPARAVAPACDRLQPTVIGWPPRLGSNVGDRRANLQAAVDALPGAQVISARVVVGLRHRAGRRGARPARVPQRGRARGRPRSSRTPLDACKAVERELGRQDGRRAPRAAADRRGRAAARRRGLPSPSGCGCRTRR